MRQSAVINKIANIMKSLFPETKTFLYGSQARNTANPDSDIDLLILLPDSFQGQEFVKRRSQIVNKLYDVEIDECVRISPMVLVKSIWESRKTPFTLNVMREGIAL